MRLRTNMTPVVGTALAAVAAGSLVLFSLVLQDSAFNSSLTEGLRPVSPSAEDESVSVLAPQDAAEGGDEATVAEAGSGADETPTTAGDTFSPLPGDDDDGDGTLIASVDEPPGEDGDFPSVVGESGSTVSNGSDGPIIRADGPRATINKDPSGPDDVTLPDRNGPKNSAPQGSPPRSDDHEDERDERQKAWDEAKKNKAEKNERQKSWEKGKGKKQGNSNAKSKNHDNGKSKNQKSKDDKSKSHDNGKKRGNGNGKSGQKSSDKGK
ncbi:MAG: hypothetical protein ACRDJL_04415, partial [Actinomycetota bacterium]